MVVKKTTQPPIDNGEPATAQPKFPSTEWFSMIAEVPLKEITEECEKKLRQFVEEHGIEAFRQVEAKCGQRYCGSGDGVRKVKGELVGTEGKDDDKQEVLTMEELEISRYAEKKRIVDINRENKKKGIKKNEKTEKSSFTCEVSFGKATFEEMNRQIKAPNGKDYTAKAFAHAINYYLHHHLKIGFLAATERTIGHKHYNQSGNTDGLDIPETFMRTEFLNGFFDTDEAKEQMDKYISTQKVAQKKPKKTLNDQIAEFDGDEDEIEAMIKKLQAKKKAKQTESEASSSEEEQGDSDENSD